MRLKNTKLRTVNIEREGRIEASTGVSLHCHTHLSKELVTFVPHYADKLPIIRSLWRKERAAFVEREGFDVNFETGFWSPPLNEHEVFAIEKKQIENLGLNPIVSITDHDEITGNVSICEETPFEFAPISLEWTVPYRYGFFHVGVHNLPKRDAHEISQKLLDYTFNEEIQDDEHLNELFSTLNEMPGILIILNHPMWDIGLLGRERHQLLLKHFIGEHGKWIHALEINGFRAWSENKTVIELAESLGKPLCSGGDRHGCQPNSVINITDARTFSEFVEEVRKDKRSEVVLMPQYYAPLHSRQLQSFSEILSYYEHFPEGRKFWFDRAYFENKEKQLLPISQLGMKRGGPKWLRASIQLLRFLGNPALRPVFSIFRKGKDVVPKSFEDLDLEIDNGFFCAENDGLIRDN